MEKITPMTLKQTEVEEAHGGILSPRGDSMPPWGGAIAPPDPEVSEKKPRRKFSAKYKLRILEEVEKCTQPGQIGSLLRREGLYSSNLTTWRKQRDEGQLQGLNPKKRGRKAKPVNPLARRAAELERETQQLRKKLKKAELIIDFQKKISEILGIPQETNERSNS